MALDHDSGCHASPAVDRRALFALTGAVSCIVLVSGALVYVTERDSAHVALMPVAMSFPVGPLFGRLGQWLPSFAHPFAFALLWAATRSNQSRPAYGACVGWWLLNLAFETGQHPVVSASLATLLHQVFGDGRLTGLLAGYFVHGTFDHGDLIAATAGALAAAAWVRILHSKGRFHAV